ncbi:MAG: trua3 [Chlamydiales bacterium]|jgi:tRNA pseudouridine38-40 synthase|nr:trua3 [Chlamydiales bacterium]
MTLPDESLTYFDTQVNLRAKIAYDGTNYLGWQKTTMGPSIEESLQNVLEKILQQRLVLQAASRTDARVHAEGQVINFYCLRPKISLNRLQLSTNALLPKDITLLQIEEAPYKFHPTLDAIGKEYHYHMCYGPILLPLLRHHVWHYPYDLNIEEMKQAIPYFLGKHRFAALRNFRNDLDLEDDIRTIREITILHEPPYSLKFIIKGDHFLYKMVRNLVGTLVYVGRGKILRKEIPHILTSRNRTQAGITAPAHGLTLKQVFYC